ncbi:hypothetical protein HanIR_Chr05g0243471 [Helianthus annuus]|nr:hypothetical protein HanIR_Chr05g0243471 [Helianthus annuus]
MSNFITFIKNSIFLSISSKPYNTTRGSLHNTLNASLYDNPCLCKQSILNLTLYEALNAPSLKILSFTGTLHFKLFNIRKHFDNSPTSDRRIFGFLTISSLISLGSNPISLNSPINGFNLFSTPNPKTPGYIRITESILLL